MAANFIKQVTVRRFLAAAVGLAVVVTVAGVSLGDRSPQQQSHYRKHICTYPKFDPNTASGCDQEINAYAAALAALQDAQNAADAAYEAWYACENGGGQHTVGKPQISADYSVLVR